MPEARMSVGFVVKPWISGSRARRRMPGTSAPSAKIATRRGVKAGELSPATRLLAIVATAVGHGAAQRGRVYQQRCAEGHEAGHHQEQAADGEIHGVCATERESQA